jgi:hypothetical protein
MKISRRKVHTPSRLVLLLVLCLAVFAPSLFPMAAGAVSRKESAGPLLGDPTDTNDGPVRGPSKSSSKAVVIATQISARQGSRGRATILVIEYLRWLLIGGSLR